MNNLNVILFSHLLHCMIKMRRAAVAYKTQESKALKVVKELDAFPKVPDNFKQTSASGGGGKDYILI